MMRLAGGRICVGLIVILGIAAYYAWHSKHRFSAVVAAAGGEYYRVPDPSRRKFSQTVQRMIARLQGNGSPEFDVVEFRPGKVCDEWLRRHQPGLTHLSNLTLVLQDSPVGDEGMDVLGSLKNLHSLDLSGTKTSESGLRIIASLPRLSSLNIPATELSPSAIKILVLMPELYALGLEADQVTPESIEYMAQMPKLASLTVYGATDDTVRLFGNSKKFQSITLHDSAVTEASIPTLKAVPGITLLSFTDRELTDEQLKEFKVALPGCYVQHVTAKEIQEMRDSGL